jgi:hypothetical protein
MAAAVMRALAGVLLVPAAAAQPLADPTLPPQALASDRAAAARDAPRPLLQFTLRGPHDTYRALLAGRWVGAGERVAIDGAEFRVERVTDSSVVLVQGTERQVIEMAAQARQAVQLRENGRSSR